MAALLCAPGLFGPAPPEEVPAVVQSNIASRSAPLWVSAAAMVGEDGALRWNLLSPSDERTLQDYLETDQKLRQKTGAEAADPADRGAGEVSCPTVFGPPSAGRVEPKPNGSLADLVANSRSIVVGRVVRVQEGFFDGLPQSLVQVKVDEALRPFPGFSNAPQVLLAYPWARFSIAGESFCMGAPNAPHPEPGDRILAFLYDESLDDRRLLLSPDPVEVVFESERGLHFGGDLGAGDELYPVESLSEVVELVRNAMSEGR